MLVWNVQLTYLIKHIFTCYCHSKGATLLCKVSVIAENLLYAHAIMFMFKRFLTWCRVFNFSNILRERDSRLLKWLYLHLKWKLNAIFKKSLQGPPCKAHLCVLLSILQLILFSSHGSCINLLFYYIIVKPWHGNEVAHGECCTCMLNVSHGKDKFSMWFFIQIC